MIKLYGPLRKSNMKQFACVWLVKVIAFLAFLIWDTFGTAGQGLITTVGLMGSCMEVNSLKNRSSQYTWRSKRIPSRSPKTDHIRMVYGSHGSRNNAWVNDAMCIEECYPSEHELHFVWWFAGECPISTHGWRMIWNTGLRETLWTHRVGWDTIEKSVQAWTWCLHTHSKMPYEFTIYLHVAPILLHIKLIFGKLVIHVYVWAYQIRWSWIRKGWLP